MNKHNDEKGEELAVAHEEFAKVTEVEVLASILPSFVHDTCREADDSIEVVSIHGVSLTFRDVFENHTIQAERAALCDVVTSEHYRFGNLIDEFSSLSSDDPIVYKETFMELCISVIHGVSSNLNSENSDEECGNVASASGKNTLKSYSKIDFKI